MKFKALDTETGEIKYFDCVPCDYCKKWLVNNSDYKYCQYCGRKKEPTPSGNGISSSDEKNLQFNYKRLRRSCQC